MNFHVETEEEQRQWIDNASYLELLRRWRHSENDRIFQGEMGVYYAKVMAEKKKLTLDNGVSASKFVGWGC